MHIRLGYIMIVVVHSLLNQIYSQSDPIKNINILNGTNYIKISERIVDKLNSKYNNVLLSNYDKNTDVNWPQEQLPANVYAAYTRTSGNREIIKLFDDGFHCDNKNGDGIFGNYMFIDIEDFLATEEEFEICCYYSEVVEDSIGLYYHILSPPVSKFPSEPIIFFPKHNATLNLSKPIIHWEIDKKANFCSIILLSDFNSFGDIFKNHIWSKDFEVKGFYEFQEEIPLKLEKGIKYDLVIISSIYANLTAENVGRESYSMQWVSFQIDTTIVYDSFIINPNYPNPFSETTCISWYQPKESRVELNIYNVLGQKVRSLYQETFLTGFNSIHWDCRDDYSKKLPSGIYVLAIKFEKTIKILKMILEK